ncbi:HAMP domain-containing histidine kinase [Plantibacter sp. MCCC 1A11337]|uniref:sensor histidine kinase n=1 Tax=Plantibacter TaxID=190323 RepID=UPI00158266F8|nr:HAMP domain-containing histidine kinase [Plantibacter sp. MCCC 1A11337]
MADGGQHGAVALRRRPWRSVRARAALGSVLAVGVFLGVGSVAFVGLFSAALRSGVEQSASAEAESVSAQLVAADATTLPEDDGRLLVLVEDGRVVDRTDDEIELPTPIPDGDVFVSVVDDEPVVFASEDVDVDGRDLVVLAGRSLEETDDAVGLVSMLLLIAVPVLVALLGGLTWLLVGRALAPVERIRREVSELGAGELHRRIEVPATGDEIGRLAGTMNGMLERLEDAQTAQRRFVSDASHELRSPLAVIRQYAEVAALHPDRVDPAELSSTVLEEGARMQGLVESLLLLAKLDEGAAGTGRRTVDVDDLLLAEAARLRSAGGLRVESAAVAAARVDGDDVLLARVVRNLVDNAVRHARSVVRLGSATDGRFVRISVEDDGPGVPVESRAHVFERFVRLDESRSRDAGGSGLGLAIVADVVRLHGGSIELVDSALGGAAFIVTLPASSAS